MQAQVQRWYRDPRSFWQDFKSKRGIACSAGLPVWSAYFKGVFHGGGEQRLVDESVASHIAHHADCFPQVTDPRIHAAQCLNADISQAEVAAAIKKLQDHKATGVDGLPAEFISHATMRCEDGVVVNVLTPHITCLFNKVLHGNYPTAWASCAVVPVFKGKGDATVMDNYRGIAVGNALAKLYSLVLLARLDDWAEAGRWRAHGQAGFRAGRGTLDNIFILNHVIEKSRQDRKPVFTAFIDFRKAYDSVNRDLLWEVLKGMGVHGDILNTLRGMYSSVGMRVRLKGHLGESFQAETGVKQGDPLSPLLFGLFIDRFESYLTAKCGDMGVPLAQGLLRALLYADDLTLTASSAEQLQSMLDCLHNFANAYHLTVNIAKSVVVVFNRYRVRTAFTYAGGALPVATEFTYLGIKFKAKGSLSSALACGITKAQAAWHGMINRCKVLGVYNVMVLKRLFEALVVSVLNYGCQVWGPYELSSMHTNRMAWGEKADVEELQKMFLRTAMQVPKSTTIPVMMSEGRCSPLMHTWFKQSITWWNSVVVRRNDDLLRCAVNDSIDMAAAGCTTCWGAAFVATVSSVHPDAAALVRAKTRVDKVSTVIDALTRRWQVHSWGDHHFDAGTALRDIQESAGFKTLTYKHWFCHDRVGVGEPARCPVGQRQGFAYHVNQPQQIRMLSTFRMGCHKLNIEWLRHKLPVVPRPQRLCECCDAGVVEDEMHIFECTLYGALRDEFGLTQAPMTDAAMYTIMNPTTPFGWKQLAVFLQKVFLERASNVDADSG
jgi:hypothetical protein